MVYVKKKNVMKGGPGSQNNFLAFYVSLGHLDKTVESIYIEPIGNRKNISSSTTFYNSLSLLINYFS